MKLINDKEKIDEEIQTDVMLLKEKQVQTTDDLLSGFFKKESDEASQS
jgi:hypothetical protein